MAKKKPRPPKPEAIPGKVKYRSPKGRPIERPLNRVKSERRKTKAPAKPSR